MMLTNLKIVQVFPWMIPEEKDDNIEGAEDEVDVSMVNSAPARQMKKEAKMQFSGR